MTKLDIVNESPEIVVEEASEAFKDTLDVLRRPLGQGTLTQFLMRVLMNQLVLLQDIMRRNV